MPTLRVEEEELKDRAWSDEFPLDIPLIEIMKEAPHIRFKFMDVLGNRQYEKEKTSLQLRSDDTTEKKGSNRELKNR